MRHDYTLAELAEAAGMTERNVRAYRSRGLIRPPSRRGRNAVYGHDHLTQLRLVQALTSRGLTLGLVGSLVDRGVAQTELARMVRDELPDGPPVEVDARVVEHHESAAPGLLARLAALGMGRRTRTGYAADPGLLALANQLALHGVEPTGVSRVLVAAAQAAQEAAEEVRRELAAPRRPRHGREPVAEPREDVETVAAELATTAFRLALTARLARP